MGRINWQEILKLSEEQIEDLRYTGYAYLRQGKYDVALSFFEALSALDRNSAYDSQTIGALYLEMGQPEKALKYLEKALKIEADHAPTLLNMCKALFMVGKTDEGLKLAAMLKNENEPHIANVAKALILAHS
jgi:tetratricopeptide (TPR) repeat protein